MDRIYRIANSIYRTQLELGMEEWRAFMYAHVYLNVATNWEDA